MSISTTNELQAAQRPYKDLPGRLLNGECFMIRNCLQEIGLLDTLINASYKGIEKELGKERADKVMELGLDQIHQLVEPSEIPGVTDAAYEFIEPKSLNFLKKFVSEVIGDTKNFYFERKPNVRFHIPHDIAAPFLNDYKQFSHRRGDGKITPHRAHRDPWVDCPENLINVWIAVGTVRKGNGLTIYPETYHSNLRNDGPYIAKDEKPGPANTYDMEPGDVLMFHGNHVHGSEINVTDSTRHVISFRIVLDKPKYTFGHHHHYAWSPLSGGIFDSFAEIPQNLAWSYFNYKIFQVNRKLRQLLKLGTKKTVTSKSEPEKQRTAIALSELKPGVILPWSKTVCVTRTEKGEILAFSRHCPHEGADLAFGVIEDNQVKCPWHNLSIDPASGKSACQSLKQISTYYTEVKDDQVVVLGKKDVA